MLVSHFLVYPGDMGSHSVALCVMFVSPLALGDPDPKSLKFDFAILDDSCQMLTAALAVVPNRDPVSSGKGEAGSGFCSRTSRSVHCRFFYDSMSKPLEVDYNVRVDTFSLVVMANSRASDVIYADPQQHVFVST